MPFKIDFEVKSGDSANLSRKLSQKKTGFSASPNGNDCSHNAEGCWYGGYTRVSCPSTTMNTGGLDDLASAVDVLREELGMPGSTAAMRIAIDGNILDDEAVTNLVNMHLANEAIIYRLGMAGGPGRSMADKQQYCPPLTNGTRYTQGRVDEYGSAGYYARYPGIRSICKKQSVSAWRSQLSHYHWGMNAHQGGWWQFRYFDTSFDAQAMKAKVELLLGMVKAAVEGRGKWDTVRPLLNTAESEIPREQWDHFIDTVAPGPLGVQLEAYFRAAGGRLPLPTVPAHAVEALSKLIESSYRFVNPADPRGVLPLQQLTDRLTAREDVAVVAPGASSAVVLTAAQACNFALAETGNAAPLPDPVRVRLQAIAPLPLNGISFESPAGTPLSPAMAAVLLEPEGRVVARHGGEVTPLVGRSEEAVNGAMTLGAFRDNLVLTERLNAATPEQAKWYSTLNVLADRGVTVRHNGATVGKGTLDMFEAASGLGTVGVRVRTPRWTVWNGWLRRSFTVKSEAALTRLSEKFAS